MITNICLLLEALSIVICLHHLYGEKFKLDIVTTSFLAVNMIVMTTINYYNLPKIYTMVIYPIIVIYCGMKFGFKIRALIINNILYMAIISCVQLIVTWIYYFMFGINFFVDLGLLIINSLALMVVLLILPLCRLNKISVYLQDKEYIFVITLFISIVVAIFCLSEYKKNNILGGMQYIGLFMIIFVICMLAAQLGKYKIKSKEIETELKMHKLYADSFQNLIENIRTRQHEFDNHIQMIYDQHYACSTYEELVNAQREYYRDVAKDNRYNKLLITGNPVLIGFLYGQFMEAERHHVEISYKISIREFQVGVPIYKMVEILGNLIRNAVEAMEVSEMEKRLHVAMIETNGEFTLEVRNRSREIPYSEIELFFKKGYSQKGNNRGFGLYNVKSICSEYQLHLTCNNQTVDGQNWLCFQVTNKTIPMIT